MATRSCHRSSPRSGRKSREDVKCQPFSSRLRHQTISTRLGTDPRIVCINALHHFSDHSAFFREAHRVLRRRGALLTIGLDPHTGSDRWWVYDYFPEALIEDRKRYPAAEDIRARMEIAGFLRCETVEVQHFARQLTVQEALNGGFLDRTSTSQFMVISPAAYEAGVARVHSGNADAWNERLLSVDLRLYGTTGWAA